MNLDVLAPAFARSLTQAGSPSQAVDTVTLDHGQINSHIGMIDEPMTELIMRLHAGEDASKFPNRLAAGLAPPRRRSQPIPLGTRGPQYRERPTPPPTTPRLFRFLHQRLRRPAHVTETVNSWAAPKPCGSSPTTESFSPETVSGPINPAMIRAPGADSREARTERPVGSLAELSRSRADQRHGVVHFHDRSRRGDA